MNLKCDLLACTFFSGFVYNIFQVLSRLCSHSCAGEELARKDDLSLLFRSAKFCTSIRKISNLDSKTNIFSTFFNGRQLRVVSDFCHKEHTHSDTILVTRFFTFRE